MNPFRKIAVACLIGAFLLPATSFAHKDKKDKKDNGKHKGWYKNPNNPHHPNHVSKHKCGKGEKDEKDGKYETRPRSIIIGLPKGTKDEPGPKGPTVGTKPGEGKGQ